MPPPQKILEKLDTLWCNLVHSEPVLENLYYTHIFILYYRTKSTKVIGCKGPYAHFRIPEAACDNDIVY